MSTPSGDQLKEEYRPGRKFPYVTGGEWVLLADVPNGSKALYFALRGHVNGQRGDDVVWPTQDSLADFLGLSRGDQVKKHLTPLIEIGAVDAEYFPVPGGGSRKRLVYTVHETPPPGYQGLQSFADYYRDKYDEPDGQSEPAGQAAPQKDGAGSEEPPHKKSARRPAKSRSAGPQKAGCNHLNHNHPNENQGEQERSVSDDGAAEPGVGDVSEAAAPRSDAPSETQGFTAEDIRGCVKDPGEVSDADAAVMAKRADEVTGWGYTRDQVCELLAGVRKKSAVKEFLARTASPDEVAAALEGGKDVAGARPDVDELCELLADGIARNGYNRPVVDREWRKHARLMLDTGYALQKKIDLEGAKRVLAWAMENRFWGARGNIKSMYKFRDQFERLAGDAREEHKNRRSGGGDRPKTRWQQSQDAVDNFGEQSMREWWGGIADPNGYGAWQEAVRTAEARGEAPPPPPEDGVFDGDTGEPVAMPDFSNLPSLPV